MVAQVALLLHKTIKEVEAMPYVHIQRILAVHNASQRLQDAAAKGQI